MAVRGKIRLSDVTEHYWGAKTLKFEAMYDPTIPEDQRYAKATPSASFSMQVDNPAALEQFQVGKYYYIDFTPVES